MEIIQLNEKDIIIADAKLNKAYLQFQELLQELRKRELPEKIAEFINHSIEDLNSSSCAGKELIKLFRNKQAKIVELLEKELKIVPRNYYKNLWTALGISIFGVPLGVALGLTIFDNIAFMAVGIPIGLVIGIAVGTEMDKKAFKEGRQLDLEIKN